MTSARHIPTPAPSAEEAVDALAAALVGGGIFTMALFPLTVPVLALVVVPLLAVALVVALAGLVVAAVAAAPWLLLRLLRRLAAGMRRPARRPRPVTRPA